jgi:lysophospholipase L1-like esterase
MKSLVVTAAGWLVAAGLAACSSGQQEPVVDMSAVKADLQVVSRARVLFAHQSVGRNIIEGVQSLARQAEVPLRVQQIDGLPPDDGPGLFHVNAGVNGDPNSKIEAFAGLLNRPERPAYDVALVKFCYEDLERAAKGRAGLLQRYAARIDALRSTRPDVRLVHASVPLRADPPGWKTTVKRWLGRDTEEDADNIARNAYNAELRARFGDVGFFDVAAVESTLPNGRRSSFSGSGTTVYTLARAYTQDGGHLNDEGRRRAAAALLHTLARTLQPGA